MRRAALVLLLMGVVTHVPRATAQSVTSPSMLAPVASPPVLWMHSEPQESVEQPLPPIVDEPKLTLADQLAPAMENSMIAQGRAAFEVSCTQCHEAEKALKKSMTFGQWLSVIQEMSEKEDAEIDPGDFHSIAAYLSITASESLGPDEEAPMAALSQPSPALVAAGEAAFRGSCVQCHDAERSLSIRKSVAAWRATVKRMAAKDGANVRSSDVEAIATYLASQHEGGVGNGAESLSPWSFSTTLSTLHRGSSDAIENPGFFVDAWLGADWQSEGPLRATVMVCTSCHSDRNTGKGFTFELVEASATVDLKRVFSDDPSSAVPSNGGSGHAGMSADATAASLHTSDMSSEPAEFECPVATAAELKVGRFVVPFGAFSSVSHPGSYRTVSNPLMYNMGRRITAGGSYQPVLPAPYSDEGMNLHLGLREYCDRSYTLDLYVVNGLQGNTSGVNFNPSRSYSDNNGSPAVGGRFTLGNQRFRLGASGMTGRMQNAGNSPLDYHIVGADASVRGERFRGFFEYAMRVDDLGLSDRNETDGYIIELEYKLRERLGFLARYDTLEHQFVDEKRLRTERFTWGFNLTLPRAGLLLLNHEHWMLPDRTDVDVVGLRWITTF